MMTIRLFILSMVGLVTLNVGTASAQSRLRVALVSGSESPDYQANLGMTALKVYLERHYAMDCTLVTSQEGPSSFTGLEALRIVDTAVFFVRRKTPAPADLALIREFVDSGKGFVALRTTSHAWENWPEFDQDVLGAKYRGTFAKKPTSAIVNVYPHAVFTGNETFAGYADQEIYAYENLASDAQVLMEAVVGEKTVPLAWARVHRGGRVFYLAPGGIDYFRNPRYQGVVGNAVLWVARRPIPGATAIVQRTFMPDAAPGAFAVTFPEGPGACYDPARGGLNYIWEGDFVDLRPRWTTKQGEAPNLFGPIYFKDREPQPWRTGSDARGADYQFLGYRLGKAGPTFKYTVDSRGVEETWQALAGGTGLKRIFRVEGRGPLWLMVPDQPDAELTVTGATREKDRVRFEPTAAHTAFELTIRRKGAR